MSAETHATKQYKSHQKNFTLHIKNFGPISDAKIVLKPLTVLIGPNNSGKSYTAMLVHSIILAYAGSSPWTHFSKDLLINVHKFISEHFIGKSKKQKNSSKIVFDSIIDNATRSAVKNIEQHIPLQISRNFSSELKDIVRINGANFSVRMNDPKVNIGLENGLCKVEYLDLVRKVRVVFDEQDDISVNRGVDGDVTLTLPMAYAYLEPSISPSYTYDLVVAILKSVKLNTHGHIPAKSHYLPAARSGILQGHKTITASVIRNAPYAGVRDTHIPPFSGVIADFISTIITMPEDEGYFYELVKNMDYEILDGRVTLAHDKHRIPDISYEFMDQNIPFHRTSSTVSELAPLILYLKHVAREGDLLIVEEPEAHLHPANQLILARYVARLIRAGLKVLITTHSHFILEQLSILLQSSNVDPSTRKEMELGDDEYLNADEVSPYIFCRMGMGDHVAEPIECTAEEGISQEDFVRVQEMLYKQTIRIERDTS